MLGAGAVQKQVDEAQEHEGDKRRDRSRGSCRPGHRPGGLQRRAVEGGSGEPAIVIAVRNQPPAFMRLA
jgi:hypothetical protein